MERGVWWVRVHGLQRIGHDLETKQQQEYLDVDTKDEKNQDIFLIMVYRNLRVTLSCTERSVINLLSNGRIS